jgi:hypothetical protein
LPAAATKRGRAVSPRRLVGLTGVTEHQRHSRAGTAQILDACERPRDIRNQLSPCQRSAQGIPARPGYRPSGRGGRAQLPDTVMPQIFGLSGPPPWLN